MEKNSASASRSSRVSQWKNVVLSAIAFFGTLGILSVGYSAYSGLSTVTAGQPLTVGMWTQVKDNFDSLNARTVNISSLGGNVGIGTASPKSPLYVWQNGAWATPSLSSDNGVATFSTATTPELQIGWYPNSPYAIWMQVKRSFNDGSSYPLALQPLGGNVGIATASPAAKLDVNGDVKIGNSSATCNTTTEGSQRYNATTKQMEFCNGTVWKSFRPHITTCSYNDTSNTAGWKYHTWIASDCTQGLPQSGVTYDRIANYTNTSGGGSPGNQNCSSDTQGGVYNPGVAQNYAMKCTYVEVR